MQLIPADIDLDFMGKRRGTAVLSAVLVGVSLVSLAALGLNLGIDFKGGNAVILAFDEEGEVDRMELEETIAGLVREETGDDSAQVKVQDFAAGGGGASGPERRRFMVYTEVSSLLGDDKRKTIESKMAERFGDSTRVDVPASGGDTFYVEFDEAVPVLERKKALEELFAGMDYEDVDITSDVGRKLDVEYFRKLNMAMAEKRRSEGDGSESSAPAMEVMSREQWQKQKEKELEGEKDTRFTIAVEEFKSKVEARLGDAYGDDFAGVESATSVSPAVGEDLFNNGLLAILYALLGILLYIILRFDVRFAPGAVVALAHDVIITIGIFSLFQIKFSLPIIAALLTIVGYSLNDTIVVLDRVRETFDAYRGRDIRQLLNRAINQTLARTVMTSLTTLFVIISILVFGGGLIRDFALALLIGVLVGTYSSMFVASPLVYYMDQYLARREGTKRETTEEGATKPARA